MLLNLNQISFQNTNSEKELIYEVFTCYVYYGVLHGYWDELELQKWI